MKKIMTAMIVLLLMMMIFLPASADEEALSIYTLYDERGNRITTYAGTPDVNDEYIAGDNTYYRIKSVDKGGQTAVMENIGNYPMPDISYLVNQALPVSSVKKAIAIYCTHSDESYEPTDGTSSNETRGSIYDVADSLKNSLEQRGVTVYFDEATHYPHDAGAYRRSRSTASDLLQEGVDAIFDIHRDGIPDPDEYVKVIDGESTTKVRLLVGRANQNNEANKEFAAKIKAVADEVYPGLIKDIYIGKGTYNQDLAPHSILLEFGTHTIKKERAIIATDYIAEVITRTLYGGLTGAAGSSDVNYNDTSNKTKSASEDSGGAWTGILWAICVLVVGALIYAFATTGGRDAMHKFGRSFQEMTGGLFGRKKE